MLTFLFSIRKSGANAAFYWLIRISYNNKICSVCCTKLYTCRLRISRTKTLLLDSNCSPLFFRFTHNKIPSQWGEELEDGQTHARHYRGCGAVHQPRAGPRARPARLQGSVRDWQTFLCQVSRCWSEYPSRGLLQTLCKLLRNLVDTSTSRFPWSRTLERPWTSTTASTSVTMRSGSWTDSPSWIGLSPSWWTTTGSSGQLIQTIQSTCRNIISILLPQGWRGSRAESSQSQYSHSHKQLAPGI